MDEINNFISKYNICYKKKIINIHFLVKIQTWFDISVIILKMEKALWWSMATAFKV